MGIYDSPKPARHTLELAKRREAETGKAQYVVRAGDIFIIEERMPMLGLWYTADGVRHG